MIKKQFTLYLENKPGALAKITSLLAMEKINLEGISVSASTDVGLVQIVPGDSESAKKVLMKANVPFTVQDVALLPLQDKPGSLAEAASALAKAGININYVYATTCDCEGECNCNVVISAPNLAKVESVWKKL